MTRSTLCGATSSQRGVGHGLMDFRAGRWWGKGGVGREHDGPSQLISVRNLPLGELVVGQTFLTKGLTGSGRCWGVSGFQE